MLASLLEQIVVLLVLLWLAEVLVGSVVSSFTKAPARPVRKMPAPPPPPTLAEAAPADSPVWLWTA